MIYFVSAISIGCIYFIIRGLRSQQDHHSTLTALYFIVVPLLGMMIGDAIVEIKINESILIPDGPSRAPLVIGVVLGFLVAFASYPFLKKDRKSPNQAL